MVLISEYHKKGGRSESRTPFCYLHIMTYLTTNLEVAVALPLTTLTI